MECCFISLRSSVSLDDSSPLRWRSDAAIFTASHASNCCSRIPHAVSKACTDLRRWCGETCMEELEDRRSLGKGDTTNVANWQQVYVFLAKGLVDSLSIRWIWILSRFPKKTLKLPDDIRELGRAGEQRICEVLELLVFLAAQFYPPIKLLSPIRFPVRSHTKRCARDASSLQKELI